MKVIHHPFRSAVLLSGLLAVAACTDTSSEPAPVAVKDAVATVNGVAIGAETLNVYARNRMRQDADALTDEQRDNLIKELQDLYLLSELAKQDKLDRDPETVAQLDFQRRSILAGAFANNFIETNEPTEEEIRAEYEKTTTGDAGKEYKARHILVPTEDEAKALIAELDEGANFEELAKEKSTGPSGPSGGDLGWFPPNRMVPPFSEAVVALEDNAYTKEPVQTQFGFHVILREGSRDLAPPPFDTLKEQIKPRLAQTKFRDFLDAEREKATLTP
ncbi:MAG: peptidylprolyl isomerase [Pseudomonadota bacterium]